MRFTGWQRIVITICVFTLIIPITIVFVLHEEQTNKRTLYKHQDEIIERLPEPPLIESEREISENVKLVQGKILISLQLGDKSYWSISDKECEDARLYFNNAFGRKYLDEIDHQIKVQKRMYTMKYGSYWFAGWFVFCVLLWVLYFTLRWIRAGFKG